MDAWGGLALGARCESDQVAKKKGKKGHICVGGWSSKQQSIMSAAGGAFSFSFVLEGLRCGRYYRYLITMTKCKMLRMRIRAICFSIADFV